MRPVLFFLLMLIVSACATSTDAITVQNSWGHSAAIGEDTSVYMDISNRGRADVRLTRFEATIAETTDVYENIFVDSLIQMRSMENNLVIPAGETVSLEPGKIHLRLFNLQAELTEGSRVEVQLYFDNGATVIVDAPVYDEAPPSNR